MIKMDSLIPFVLGCMLGFTLHLLKFNFVSQTWDKGAMYPSVNECVISESAPCKGKIAEVYYKAN